MFRPGPRGEGVDVQTWSQGGGEGVDVQTWSRGRMTKVVDN